MSSKKLYLMVFSAHVDRELLTKKLSSLDDTYWFYSLPFSVFIKTNYKSKEILESLNDIIGVERCFITEIKNNYWGKLPAEQWKHFDTVNTSDPFNLLG